MRPLYFKNFLVCIFFELSFAAGSNSNIERFTKPNNSDAITYWDYDERSKSVIVILLEEVEPPIAIANIFSNGSTIPRIGNLKDNKTNDILGAAIQTLTPNTWSIVIMEKQNYEVPSMRNYTFEAIIGLKSYPIKLYIENINDNAPIIVPNARSCLRMEECTSQAVCIFNISDADGDIENVSINISIWTSLSKQIDVFSKRNCKPISETMCVVILPPENCLDDNVNHVYVSLLTAIDSAGNAGSLITIAEVLDGGYEPCISVKYTTSEYSLIEKNEIGNLDTIRNTADLTCTNPSQVLFFVYHYNISMIATLDQDKEIKFGQIDVIEPEEKDSILTQVHNLTTIFYGNIFYRNPNRPRIIQPDPEKIIQLPKSQVLNGQLVGANGMPIDDFVAVEDTDVSDNSTEVQFELLGNAKKWFKLVRLKRNTAQLQLTKIPDLTDLKTFELVVKVTDKGKSSTSSAIRTRLEFVSASHGPKFPSKNVTVWFTEGPAGLRESITIPAAVDNVTEFIDPNSAVDPKNYYIDTYYFLQEWVLDSSMFKLNKQTRVLRLTKQLDRETTPTLRVVITASRNAYGPPEFPMQESTLLVIVRVTDVNDNTPYFEKKMYTGGLSARDPAGKILTIVKGCDADFNDSLTYQIYQLLPRRNLASNLPKPYSLERLFSFIKLDGKSGVLSLKLPGSMFLNGTVNISVIVRDQAGHNDWAVVRIYTVSEDTRVNFTFRNPKSKVMKHRQYIVDTLGNGYSSLCNIDYFEQGVTPEATILTAHFINATISQAISSENIIKQSEDYEITNGLKASFIKRSLFLTDFPTHKESSTESFVVTNILWGALALIFLLTFCIFGVVIIYFMRRRNSSRSTERMSAGANDDTMHYNHTSRKVHYANPPSEIISDTYLDRNDISQTALY